MFWIGLFICLLILILVIVLAVKILIDDRKNDLLIREKINKDKHENNNQDQILKLDEEALMKEAFSVTIEGDAVSEESIQGHLDILSQLEEDKYSILSNIVLQKAGTARRYDFIVVGIKGVFVIKLDGYEVKEADKLEGVLIVDDNDKWSVAKTGRRKHIKSPVKTLELQREMLEAIIEQAMVPVHSVFLLSNDDIRIDYRTKVNFDIVLPKDLVSYLSNYDDNLSDNDRKYIISDIKRAKSL